MPGATGCRTAARPPGRSRASWSSSGTTTTRASTRAGASGSPCRARRRRRPGAGEAVVSGAHYDHLGREGDTVYPGADDNASGTAVVLGLAQALAASRPPRTLVFALFAGEELGLLGSDYQVHHPSAVPIARMITMLNYDMVGRLDGRHLLVGGVDTGRGFRGLVEAAAKEAGLDVDLRATWTGPSGHTPFKGAGGPVLFFHSGSPPDYHRPSDTAHKIDPARK